jgi:hypothetical protein
MACAESGANGQDGSCKNQSKAIDLHMIPFSTIRETLAALGRSL